MNVDHFHNAIGYEGASGHPTKGRYEVSHPTLTHSLLLRYDSFRGKRHNAPWLCQQTRPSCACRWADSWARTACTGTLQSTRAIREHKIDSLHQKLSSLDDSSSTGDSSSDAWQPTPR